jgi:protein required for attachment to host cells
MPTWILVADASRARIFTADKARSPLNEIRTLTSPEARLHEGDLITDKGGRDRNPGTGAHGFNTDDLHKHENAERFASQVCHELESARNSGGFRKLYVVAAPGFLGMLRRHQSAALRGMVAGEIDKNLATQDPATIRKSLPDFL